MSEITKQEAKDLTIKLWEWLADNPDKYKKASPYWSSILWFKGHCPLCEVHSLGDDVPPDCLKCCLGRHGNGCLEALSPFQRWQDASIDYPHSLKTRHEAALEIVIKVAGWNVEEEGGGVRV